MKHGVVPEFRGEHFFLSNYCYTPFRWRGIDFGWGEQAFAYAKTFFARIDHEGENYRDMILAVKAADEAKKLGRKCKIDVDTWDKRRVQYMREIVHAKFATGEGDLVGQLLNTGAMMLVEGNDWGDTFWGRCLDKTTGKRVGLNTLGVLLMEERGYWLYSDFSDKKKEKQ